jgi:hypothetical protein
MMANYDTLQAHMQNAQPQWGFGNPQYGPGQAAYGQQFGQYGGSQWGQPNIGGSGSWGQTQRQLSPYEVGDVVRQLVPLLPQILAQTQQMPQAAYGYGYGATGQYPRLLTQQDVTEVLRQIIPILPQVIGLLQNQGPFQGAAMYGGQGMPGGLFAQHPFGQVAFGQIPTGQFPLGHMSQPFPMGQMSHLQQSFGQQAWPQFLGAFGGPQTLGSQAFGTTGAWSQPQRQLTEQDVNEVARQLVGIIPQVVGNLRTFNQQRMN